MSALCKLDRTRTDGSDLLGANAGVAAGMPCSWQGRDYSGATTQDVVEATLCTSSSNKLGIKPVEQIDYVGKMRLLSRATIQGRGGNRYVEVLDLFQSSVP
jgi:hypothetical protein